jgi:hypothetical protein
MIQRMNKQRWLTVFITVLFSGAAQVQAALPPQPGKLPEGSPLYAYGIAVVLLAGVCVAAFKNSKRSHLD